MLQPRHEERGDVVFVAIEDETALFVCAAIGADEDHRPADSEFQVGAECSGVSAMGAAFGIVEAVTLGIAIARPRAGALAVAGTERSDRLRRRDVRLLAHCTTIAYVLLLFKL
jgi:hypothetical protein